MKIGDKFKVIGNKYINHHFPIGNIVIAVSSKDIDRRNNGFKIGLSGKDMYGYVITQTLNLKDLEPLVKYEGTLIESRKLL